MQKRRYSYTVKAVRRAQHSACLQRSSATDCSLHMRNLKLNCVFISQQKSKRNSSEKDGACSSSRKKSQQYFVVIAELLRIRGRLNDLAARPRRSRSNCITTSKPNHRNHPKDLKMTRAPSSTPPHASNLWPTLSQSQIPHKQTA